MNLDECTDGRHVRISGKFRGTGLGLDAAVGTVTATRPAPTSPHNPSYPHGMVQLRLADDVAWPVREVWIGPEDLVDAEPPPGIPAPTDPPGETRAAPTDGADSHAPGLDATIRGVVAAGRDTGLSGAAFYGRPDPLHGDWTLVCLEPGTYSVWAYIHRSTLAAHITIAPQVKDVRLDRDGRTYWIRPVDRRPALLMVEAWTFTDPDAARAWVHAAEDADDTARTSAPGLEGYARSADEAPGAADLGPMDVAPEPDALVDKIRQEHRRAAVVLGDVGVLLSALDRQEAWYGEQVRIALTYAQQVLDETADLVERTRAAAVDPDALLGAYTVEPTPGIGLRHGDEMTLRHTGCPDSWRCLMGLPDGESPAVAVRALVEKVLQHAVECPAPVPAGDPAPEDPEAGEQSGARGADS